MAAHPVLRRRHRTCRPDSRIGHHARHPAGQGPDRRYLARHHVDPLRRHRDEPLRHDDRRRGPAVRAGVRTHPLRLFDRSAGRTGILLLVQARWAHARRLRHGHRAAGRGGDLRHPPGDRHPHPDDGRHPLGRRDEYPGARRRAAGLCRRHGLQRPDHRSGLCRGLPAGRRGHHLLDDLHPLRSAREVREGG